MTTSSLLRTRLRYHVDSETFVFEALHHTQQMLGRLPDINDDNVPGVKDFDEIDEEKVHLSGAELLDGIRDLALERFGLMARSVFASWGITTTEDFGRIVFDMVEHGKMRKTERDQLSDFYEVYDFEQALDRDYRCSTKLSHE